MPLTRLPNGRLLYFAHVPKCAGSAVEDYLKKRFGPLGLLDRQFGRRAPGEAWSISPPQHMPEFVRRDWLPDALFDAVFATVRHPLTRLRSVFLFQREVERALPAGMPFRAWLSGLERTRALDPLALHGHLRPMAEMVPQKARVFRLEDGLDPLVGWLDEQAGTAEGPREIAPGNVLADRVETVPRIPLTPDLDALARRLYPADYKRFGYGEDLPDETLPDPAAETGTGAAEQNGADRDPPISADPETGD